MKAYVERNMGICCSQWDPAVSERLLFDPYDAAKRAWAAHYFLLNAAITETALIGRAENARALMVELHRRYGDALLRQTNAQLLNEAVSEVASLELSTDMPVKMEFEIAQGRLVYYLAPCIGV